MQAGPQRFVADSLPDPRQTPPGEKIVLLNAAGQDDVQLRLAAKQPDGSWIAEPESAEEAFALLERVGRVPLPPYIRKGEMVEADRQNYQTVYARQPGAVAAPTAGLHFTEALLRRLQDGGVTLCRLTLHVGSGTFRPIASQSLAEHKLDAEWGTIGPECVEQITACRRRGGRVVAVGTTSVRLLETAAADGTLRPFTGRDRPVHPPALPVSGRRCPADQFSSAPHDALGVGADLRRRRPGPPRLRRGDP